MIGHKLPNKTKSAIVAEPKLFHQLNNPEETFTVVCSYSTSLPVKKLDKDLSKKIDISNRN
jgi:hypothetical protein